MARNGNVKGVKMIRGRQDGQMEQDYEDMAAVLKNKTQGPDALYFIGFSSSKFSDAGKPITFDKAQAKDGSGMDKDTGIFTVPKEGKYTFGFFGQSDEINTVVSLHLNGGEKELASSSYLIARQENTRGALIEIKATVNLKKDNTVSVVLKEGEIQRGATFTGVTK